MKLGALKTGICFVDIFSWMSVYARPHPGPLPRGEGEHRHGVGQFLNPHRSHRPRVIGRETHDNTAQCMVQNAANNSPSPGGEGWGEGGRHSWFQGQTLSPTAKLMALLLFALSFSPTSLLACAACTGRTDSPLAVAMNWGIFTLLGVVLTVLSGVLVFFVHVIRKEEKAPQDTPPENPPKT